MARSTRTTSSDTLVLVSPDGDEREVTNPADEASLRWRGYLPKEQAKLEAPKPPTNEPPKPSGSTSS